MATYIPNATQTTEPVESRTVESAALEFRTLKTSINTRIEDVQDGLDAETAARIAGDANLQTQNNAQDVRLTAIENALLFIGEGGLPGTVYVQRFSGTGVQTAFTLDVVPHSGNVVDIYINGIYQNKDTFSVAGAVITFSEAPPAGTDNIEVQVTVTIALGETDASLVTYGATTVEAQLDAISAAGGSSLVGFQQAGAGAVVRTAQDKMREWVSPEDFGAVGDGVADDTVALQTAMNVSRDTARRLVGKSGATYRITSGLVTQYDGEWKRNDIDLSMCLIVADFSGGAALTITGGAQEQKVKLRIEPSISNQYSNAFDANSTGVLIQNARATVDIAANLFKGNNVIIRTTAPNSNRSDYNLSCGYGGRGLLIEGTHDDLSVCRSVVRAFGNGREGIRIEDTAAFRQWHGFWYVENNWQIDPNNAANYGCYIGKATACILWIYCEQYGTASEIYAHPTNVTRTSITSARKNKDTIVKGATGLDGKSFYQNDYNLVSGADARLAEPIEIVGRMSRVATAGEYVRVPFKGLGGGFGFVRGEQNGMHLDSPGVTSSVGVFDAYAYIGTTANRTYAKSVSLTTASPSSTTIIAALVAARSICGRIAVAGRSGGGSGHRQYVSDFSVVGTTLTINTPVINVAPGTLPPEITLSVVDGNLQLALSYNSGQYGASYQFVYRVDLMYI